MSTGSPTQQDYEYIDKVIAEANAALDDGKAGVAAMLTWRGHIMALVHNMYEETGDVTAHAEMSLLRNVAKLIADMNDKQKADLCVYVTLEPCLMCLSAISYAGIGRVVYSALSEDANLDQAVVEGLTARAVNDDLVRGPLELVPGVRREEGQKLLARMHMTAGHPDSGVGHTQSDC